MSEWISVKDGLPDIGSHVLIASGKLVIESYFDLGGNWNVNGLAFNFPVTHWMTLPNPPEV